MWISDEPFGWATYHYGRWALLRGHGWVWVPGSEWAPSWVSWRTSGSHIGWAPLPPETLAWRAHHWGNTVDVTFGIGALWFSFVEYRHFGEPIHRHCLPYARNRDYYHQTINITNIHVKNRRVVCGGPGYEDIRRKGGKSLTYYRLDVDRHGRPGRDSLAMRPRIEDGRLRVVAPNVDADWNESLKPSKIKRRLENITVERPEALKPEIAENFRKTRESERERAEKTVTELGGRESFNQRRLEKLEANRRQMASPSRDKEKPRDDKSKPADQQEQPRIQPEIRERDQAVSNEQERQLESSRRQPIEEARDRIRKPGKPQAETPQADAGQATRQPQPPPSDQAHKQQTEQARPEQEQQSEPSRQEQLDALRDRIRKPGKPQADAGQATRQPQPPPSDQAQREQEQQREQARQQQLEETRKQQLEQAQHEQEQQREQARQQQLEETRKQQLEQAQREQEQQREQARQQQLEQARQREAEEARREQQQQLEQARRGQQQELQQQREQARQQQLEQQSRQRQAEEARREQQQQLQQQRQQEQLQRKQESSRQNFESMKDEFENRRR
jgi:hypothetical protein